MNPIASIAASKLCVIKGRARIVSNMDFSVSDGSITGLIGPSGSGKTTLMRAIVGVQAITSGTLIVLDHPAGAAELRHRIGYVTQAPAIYDDLTVVQNLRYFAVLTQATHGDVDAVIAQVHLEPQRHQIVSSLSGGERARVSLAVALLGKPKLLVLDEPTVGLDPLLRRELWRLFRELAAQGKTLLVSSHVMDEAEKCDSLLLLREGELLWQGSRDGLLATTKTQRVEDAFIQMITKDGS